MSVHYEVNEQKRTVVCWVDDFRGELRREINDFAMEPLGIWINYQELDKLVGDVPKKLIGIAKCSEKDTFNVEFGKAIARNRMAWQQAKYRAEVYWRVEKRVLDKLGIAAKRFDKQANAVDKIAHNLIDLLG